MLAIRVYKPCKSVEALHIYFLSSYSGSFLTEPDFASPKHRTATQSSKRSLYPICTIRANVDTDLAVLERLFMLLIA